MGFILSECYKKQYGINTINLILPNAYGPFDHIDPESDTCFEWNNCQND